MQAVSRGQPTRRHVRFTPITLTIQLPDRAFTSGQALATALQESIGIQLVRAVPLHRY